ncbi:MAG: MBL fold metallo-hydrolase [Hyphomicrobiales bacterium]|nr:MAG: MBL fold metallo-hydrolase [Hyphomicrobiales bacterium]
MSRLERLPSNLRVLERGWLSSNSILLIGPDDTALIDSGYCTHATQTVALVRAALGRRRLDLLVNTHLHSDHCGGNAALQAAFPAMATRVPSGGAAAVAAWDHDALTYRATGQTCPRFGFQGIIAAGAEVQLGGLTWEAHGAPGHDPDALILFEPASRTLISADSLWEFGFGVVFPELIGEPSFDQVAQTFDLVERLAPQVVIPGHGAVFDNVKAALRIARDRLDRQVADPARHARHALKVLIKFKLMEARDLPLDSLNHWVDTTPYFDWIRTRFFPEETIQGIRNELIAELVSAGAIESVGDRLIDS